MNDQKFKKSWLIEQMQKNMEKHRAAFLKAQEGYKQAIIEKLENSLKAARSGKKPDLSFHFPIPTDQTKDYQRVISMLENSLEEEVVLAEHEYSMYILDEWQWKQQFAATVMNYGVSPD